MEDLRVSSLGNIVFLNTNGTIHHIAEGGVIEISETSFRVHTEPTNPFGTGPSALWAHVYTFQLVPEEEKFWILNDLDPKSAYFVLV